MNPSRPGRVPSLYQISVSNGGVPKVAISEAHVTTHGVEGDRQRNLKVHGGPDRAVCLYSLECIEALRAEGHPIVPGASGENLTIAGVDWTSLQPGRRLRIGDSVRLEIVSYTAPCEHNTQWFQGGDVSRIAQKHHPGWSRLYARVLAGGVIRPGHEVILEQGGGEGPTAEP